MGTGSEGLGVDVESVAESAHVIILIHSELPRAVDISPLVIISCRRNRFKAALKVMTTLATGL